MSSTATFAPAGTWKLDAVHSSVRFEVPYLAGRFKGEFRDVDATLQLSDDGRAMLEGVARVTSVDVKDENLAAHLQGPDFFDAERFPELRFRAEDLKLDGERASVRGEITIKGVTHPIEATGSATPAFTDGFGRERVGLTLEAHVDRTAFGIDWNMPLPTGEQALSNDVTIVADLQFTKAD